jgi:DNA-binding MarR family transcriptional regulator
MSTRSPDKLPVVDAPFCAMAMRMALRRLAQHYDHALVVTGIKSSQFTILHELDRAAAPTIMGALAKRLVLDRSTLGHNLRPLERDGLVRFQNHRGDARARYVSLTSKGRAKCRQCLALWEEAELRFKSIFGASNADSLRSTLLDIARSHRLDVL